MSFEIVPFTPDWLTEAAQLLAQRHARDRQALPLLPIRFEDPGAARAAIQAALDRPLASGVAAVENGRLLAYLVGELLIDETWGRSAWVRLPGCAAAPGQDLDVLRHLYAVLGQRWLAYGCLFHFVQASTADSALLQTWYSLSFGIEQVHGMRPLGDQEEEEAVLPRGVEIRAALPEDRRHLEDLSDVIWRHQIQAPVWGIHLPEIEAEQRRDWGNLVNDPLVNLWLAFQNGRAVGVVGMFAWEYGAMDLWIPDNAVELGVAGVRPEARGLGISRALARIGFNFSRQAGFHASVTDWRSTNLLSSRHWTHQGFRPAVYRLVRRIDPRIYWANGAGIDLDARNRAPSG